MNSEFNLINKIVAHNELGDAGKLETFFAKVRKNLAREIETLNKRVELLEFNYNRSIEDLTEAEADAQDAVDAAFLNVNVADVASNADIDLLVPSYWRGIELAKANVQTLVEKRATIVTAYEESLAEETAQINERIARLDTISEEA